MVATAGKTPRYTLTPEDRQRCLAALGDLHRRRVRRNAERQAAEPKQGVKGGREKKRARKTPMKIAKSRPPRAESAPVEETDAEANTAEAKETT